VRLFLAVVLALPLTVGAHAACVCRCVDGQMQPLCESTIDMPLVCPATLCAQPLPSIKPIQPPVLPPVGATRCSPRQVLDPASGNYEWRSVCN